MSDDFDKFIEEERKRLASASEGPKDSAVAAEVASGGESKRRSGDAKGPSGDEPRVLFCPDDRVGLALSGGGIRSATFNLGLLQGLNKYGILHMVDYLSTVSGGGYIGGWWMSWLRRQGKKGPSEKNRWIPAPGDTPGPAEADEVRHLREFSRFLSPRVGLFETDMWYAVIAYLNGAIPTTLISIAGAWLVWGVFLSVMCLSLGAAGASSLAIAGTCAALLAGLFCGLHLLFERLWRRRGSGQATSRCWSCTTNVVAALVLGGSYWFCLHHCFRDVASQFATWSGFVDFAVEGPEPSRIDVVRDQVRDLLGRLGLDGVGIKPRDPYAALFVWVRVLLFPAMFGIVLAFALTCVRWLLRFLGVFDSTQKARWARRDLAAFHDRFVGRTLLFSLVWLVVGLLWMIGCSLFGAATKQGIGSVLFVWLASSGLFAKLRNWLFQSLRPGKQAGWLESFKPVVPMLLAYLALGSGIVLACWLLLATSDGCLALMKMCGLQHRTRGEALVVTVVAGTLFGGVLLYGFDLRNMGLHMFYRRKISRAFLGASNSASSALEASMFDARCNDKQRTHNRETDELERDDFSLHELPGKPLHLVCCAANTLGMDSLATLSRGARSFVASPCGLSMGGRSLSSTTSDGKKTDFGSTYGNFLTASAAAFNSNMGSISMQLGPAAAVLATVANLRLGLWAPNPLSDEKPSDDRARGWRLIDEMFSRTGTSGPWVHLSDGGHFENLALYELVRRHCRYVIVSDCGADPETAFDDLGNALRRTREDFGVEIEIDVEPLRPRADCGGLARQHVVVGTIHYDGVTGLDKGLLIYFKPNLTGDEPPDVVQYHARNPVFPNESTIDQFYDEAQWESYRRLGEHAAHSAFRFLERPSRRDAALPEKHDVFPWMRWEWYPTPLDLERNVVEQAQELDGLLDCLGNNDIGPLCAGMFPELSQLPEVGDRQKSIVFVSRMLQLMENVWNRCRLATLENHPLNNGWVNQFARWSITPEFRLWWPFLKPLYSSGLVDFVEQRLGVAPGPGFFPEDWKTRVVALEQPPAEWLKQWKAYDHRPPDRGEPNLWYALQVDCPIIAPTASTLTVAILAAQRRSDDRCLYWNWDDLFLMPGMNGAGLGTTFLKQVIAAFKNRDSGMRMDDIDALVANLSPEDRRTENALRSIQASVGDGQATGASAPEQRRKTETRLPTDIASRNRRVDEVMTYKALGFRWEYGGACSLIVDRT